MPAPAADLIADTPRVLESAPQLKTTESDRTATQTAIPRQPPHGAHLCPSEGRLPRARAGSPETQRNRLVKHAEGKATIQVRHDGLVGKGAKSTSEWDEVFPSFESQLSKGGTC